MLNLPQKNERDQEVIVKAVKYWLMNHGEWLLILDNVEELESIGSLYPWAHSGHVIITTRSQSVGGVALSISLEKMEVEEGALFLLRRATLIGPDEGKEEAKGADFEKAKELSEVLGGLPLALDQAAAYIEKTRCGLSAYLDLYQIARGKLLSERGSLTTDHPESVTITFLLAFQKVKSASIAAGELLQFCAFLSPDAIPEEIITNGGVHLGTILEPIAIDLIKFNTAVRILLAFSLARRYTLIETGTQIVSLHTRLQALLQDALKEAERRIWATRAIHAVSAAFLYTGSSLLRPDRAYQNQAAVTSGSLHQLVLDYYPYANTSTWPQYERLLPQALTATQAIEQYQIFGEEVGRLPLETASYLRNRARYVEAEPLFLQSLQVWEQCLGLEHPLIAYPLNGLANLYCEQGRYVEAEPLYLRALRIREQHLGLEHPNVASLLSNLALLYGDQDRYAEAESLYLRVLQVWEQHMGPEHPNSTVSIRGFLHNPPKRCTRLH